MNKRQKAIRDKDKGRIMTAAEWEFATDDYKHLRKNNKKKYGFWKLLIISYLLIAFLPFSILFCVVFYGMNETIEIIKAVLRDILVTLLGLLLGIISLLILFIIVLNIFF